MKADQNYSARSSLVCFHFFYQIQTKLKWLVQLTMSDPTFSLLH